MNNLLQQDNTKIQKSTDAGLAVATQQPVATAGTSATRKITRKVIIDPNKLKALGLNRKIAKAIGQAQVSSRIIQLPKELEHDNQNAQAQSNKQPVATTINLNLSKTQNDTTNALSENKHVESQATAINKQNVTKNSMEVTTIAKNISAATTTTAVLAAITTVRISRVQNSKILGSSPKVFETYRPDLDYESLSPSVRLLHAKSIVQNHIRERLKNSEIAAEPAATLQTSQITKQTPTVPSSAVILSTKQSSTAIPTAASSVFTSNIARASTLRTRLPSSSSSSSRTSSMPSPPPTSLSPISLPPLSPPLTSSSQTVVEENIDNNMFAIIKPIPEHMDNSQAVLNNHINESLENNSVKTQEVIEKSVMPAATTSLKNHDMSSDEINNLSSVQNSPTSSATFEKPIVMENKLLSATEKFNLSTFSIPKVSYKVSKETLITPEKQISTISQSENPEQHISTISQSENPDNTENVEAHDIKINQEMIVEAISEIDTDTANVNPNPQETNAVDYLASLSQFPSKNFVLSEREKRRLLRKRKAEFQQSNVEQSIKKVTMENESTEVIEEKTQEDNVVESAEKLKNSNLNSTVDLINKNENIEIKMTLPVIKPRHLSTEKDFTNETERTDTASEKTNDTILKEIKTENNEIIIIQSDENIKEINSDEIIIVMPFDNEIAIKTLANNDGKVLSDSKKLTICAAEKNLETQKSLTHNHKMPLKKRWDLAAQQPMSDDLVTNDVPIVDDDNDFDDNHFGDNDFEETSCSSPTSSLIRKYNTGLEMQDTASCDGNDCKNESSQKSKRIRTYTNTKKRAKKEKIDSQDDVNNDVLSTFENILKTDEEVDAKGKIYTELAQKTNVEDAAGLKENIPELMDVPEEFSNETSKTEILKNDKSKKTVAITAKEAEEINETEEEREMIEILEQNLLHAYIVETAGDIVGANPVHISKTVKKKVLQEETTKEATYIKEEYIEEILEENESQTIVVEETVKEIAMEIPEKDVSNITPVEAAKTKPKNNVLETIIAAETAANITETLENLKPQITNAEESECLLVVTEILQKDLPATTVLKDIEINDENIKEILEKNSPQVDKEIKTENNAEILETTTDKAAAKETIESTTENMTQILKKDLSQTTPIRISQRRKRKLEENEFAKSFLEKQEQLKTPKKEKEVVKTKSKEKRNTMQAAQTKDADVTKSKTIEKYFSTRSKTTKNSIANNSQKQSEIVVKEVINKKSTIKELTSVEVPTAVEAIIPTEISNPTESIKAHKKPGRKPKYNLETTPAFNPRLLLVRSRAQLDTDEVLTAEVSPAKMQTLGKGVVQCGFCLALTKSDKWVQHLTEHYGIGWHTNEEPLDLTSRSVVLKTILAFFKTYQIKSLNCRMCSRLYRSALGLLIHVETCGVQQEREKCTVCDKFYNKTYFATHFRGCMSAEMAKYPEPTEKTITNTSEIKSNNTGRIKRASTIKAEKKLKELGAEIMGLEEAETKSNIIYAPGLSEKTKEKWSADIKQFGKGFCVHKLCKFEALNIEAHIKHYNSCKYTKAEGYYCLLCKISNRYNSEAEALIHIKNKHREHRNSESDYDSVGSAEPSSSGSNCSETDIDETDAETEKSHKTKSRSYNASKTPARGRFKQRLSLPRSADPTDLSYKLWKQFVSANYSTTPLFDFAQSNYKLASASECEHLLPQHTLSMKFKFAANKQIPSTLGAQTYGDDDCKQLKRFESLHHMNEYFMFLGAAVKRMEWIPLSKNISEQYLCISYGQRHRYTRLKNPAICKDCLLVFKVVPAIENEIMPTLQLQYGMLIPNGPIHCFTCLPSGGYDAVNNRLGLVIVGTADNHLSMYALPINISNEVKAEAKNLLGDLSFFLILNIEPLMQLNRINRINRLEEKAQCTSICWSEYKDHNLVLAGFSNGCVGIWDIALTHERKMNNETNTTTAAMIDDDDDFDNFNGSIYMVNGLRHARGITYVFTGEQIVRHVAMHYDCSTGARWMAVATLSRKVIVYDIRELDRPLLMKQFLPIPFVRDMFWSSIWEPVVLGYGNAVPSNCPVGGYNPSNLVYNRARFDIMNSGVLQVEYDAVNNLHVCGCENGDLVVLSTREVTLHYALPREGKENLRAIACMDLFQLNGKPLAQPIVRDDVAPENNIYDQNSKEKHAIVFMPMSKPPITKSKAFLSKERRPHLGTDYMMRINAVSVNRHQAKTGNLLIATGYENGFVRLIPFKKSNYFK